MPTLQRTVTITSTNVGITGQVSVVPGPNTAPGTCQPTIVEVFDVRNDTTRELILRAQTDETGRFAFEVPGFQAGKSYLVAAKAFLNREVAFCAAAESAVLQIPLADRDGDGVADPADVCPEVAGPGDGAYPGCPTLQRTVTVASSNGGIVTGQVSVDEPERRPGDLPAHDRRALRGHQHRPGADRHRSDRRDRGLRDHGPGPAGGNALSGRRQGLPRR